MQQAGSGNQLGETVQQQTASKQQPRRKKRRWFYRLILFLIVLLVLFTAFLYWSTQPQRFARWLSPRLSELTGIPLSIERVDHKGLSLIRLSGIRVGDEQELLQIARVELRLKPASLLNQSLIIDSLMINGLNLALIWQDSLLLPEWLSTEKTEEKPAEQDSTELAFPEWLDLSQSELDPGRVILQNAIVGIEFRGAERSQYLRSPPLGFRLDLPHMNGSQIEEALEGKMPTGLKLGMLLGWSGDWLQRPGLADLFDGAQLHFPKHPKQTVNWSSQMLGDSLKLQMQWSLRAPGLYFEQDSLQLALPDSMAFNVELNGNVKQASLGRLSAQWSVAPFGGRGQLELGLRGLSQNSPWQLELKHQLDPAELLDVAGFFSELPADLESAPSRLDLDIKMQGQLGANGLPEKASLDLRSQLLLPHISAMGAQLDSLQLELKLTGRLDLLDPAASQTLKLEMKQRLQHFSQDLNQVLDSAQVLSIPAALRSPAIHDLDLGLEVDLESPEQSATLICDLAFKGPLGRSWFVSMTSEVPPLVALLDGEIPSGRLDLAVDELPLSALDPRLSGDLSLGSWILLEEGRIQGELELIPTQWLFQLDPDQRAIEIPFYDLVVAADLEQQSAGNIRGNLQIHPAPFPPLGVELDLTPGLGGWVEASMKNLKLELIQRRLPEDLISLNRLTGRMSLLASTQLDSSYFPRWADLVYGLEDLVVDYDGLLKLEGTRINGGGFWSPDSATLESSIFIEKLSSTQLPEPLRGLHAALETSMNPALELHGEMQIPAMSLLLQLDATADSIGALPRSEVIVQALLHNQEQYLEAWPGLRVRGQLDAGAVIQIEDSLQAEMQAWLNGNLQEVSWQELAHLKDLHLDIGLSQQLDLNQYPYLKAGSTEAPPVDWNRPLAFNRQSPGVGSLKPSGWSIVIGKTEVEGWTLEDLALDLRIAEGRLDCPQLQAKAYGGTISGSFFVAIPGAFMEPEYAMDVWASGLDSKQFSFHRVGKEQKGLFPKKKRNDRLDLIVRLEGAGLDLDALDQLKGRIRLPEPGRRVTLNLLYALDERGSDPTIRRIRKLLELPGFRYSVDGLDFDISHGFVKPRVALRKSWLSPLPDVVFPMSPLPLGFMVRTFALTEEASP